MSNPKSCLCFPAGTRRAWSRRKKMPKIGGTSQSWVKSPAEDTRDNGAAPFATYPCEKAARKVRVALGREEGWSQEQVAVRAAQV